MTVSDAELRQALATAREALTYVLNHHANGHECLCPAARSVAETGLRLTTASTASQQTEEERRA
jgi:hypothetical protein